MEYTLYQKLMFAIMSGEYEQLRKQVEADKNIVTLRDKAGRTLLMEAAIFQREDTAKLLIDNGADVNAKEIKGWTALHFAIQSYVPDLVKLLISKGADVNARDHYDNTPLGKAIMNSKGGRGEIILQLLKAGADKNIPNKSGITPYYLATHIDNFEWKQLFE